MALIWLDSFLFLMNYPDKPTDQGHKLRPFECAQGSLFSRNSEDLFVCIHICFILYFYTSMQQYIYIYNII